MGSRDVRQRLAGLHSGGEFQAVGGSVVDPDARRRRREPAKAILRERHAGLSTGPRLKNSATNEHQYSRMMANRVVVQIEKEIRVHWSSFVAEFFISNSIADNFCDKEDRFLSAAC
jgi:hypothetical protein